MFHLLRRSAQRASHQRRRWNRTVTSRPTRRRLLLETLENRSLLAALSFNDPEYGTIQWGLDNTGQNGGTYDVDIDAPEAWSITTGSMSTVVSEIDDGVDFTNEDVYLNIWLNQGEIPAAIRAALTDTDVDGLITFRDLNQSANAASVSDLNGTGYIDGGDLLADSRWANGIDEDTDGKTDDLVGWDFLNNDNDPRPLPSEGHGTGMAQWMAGIPNNGIGKVGVNWSLSVLPVRVRTGDVHNVDFSLQAAGLDYSVARGAPISYIVGGNFASSPPQVLFDAIERAKVAGDLVVIPAGNDSTDLDVRPRYPASLSNDNLISVMAFDATNGMDPTWNWGATSVDLAGPTGPGGGASGAGAHVAAVAALLKTIHPAWQYQELNDRILATVEPSAAFAGKTVTGGRLNAARALATTSISVSDPTITEGDTGTSQVNFTVTRFGDDSQDITLNWSTADGSAVSGQDYLGASGQLMFSPGGASSQTVSVSAIGDLTAESSENLFIRLTLVGGTALLADAEAQATILDTDPLPTKFYVVDDASANKTFEYGPTGSAVENYSLNSGNTSPRGAASNVAGDRVWVVDSNRNVYVYNTSGLLLGSWSVSGFNNSAQFEGIAVSGNDVWIVDNKSDKVYRLTGATSRLSGSQSAASSFGLNSSNSDATDLVTDGTSIWVVNNTSSTDKVFKYAVGGSLLGSWTISSAGGSPTGITIDPSSVSNIWIVDSASDRIYEFTSAASRTSGSASPSASYALAATNTNPQGIADPPISAALDSPSGAAHDSALLTLTDELASLLNGTRKRK